MKRKHSICKWKEILFALLWTVSLGTFAQTVTVRGTVVDDTGLTICIPGEAGGLFVGLGMRPARDRRRRGGMNRDEIRVMVTGVGGGGNGEQLVKALRLARTNYRIIGADITPL